MSFKRKGAFIYAQQPEVRPFPVWSPLLVNIRRSKTSLFLLVSTRKGTATSPTMASTPTKLICPQFLFFSTRWSGRHWARSHHPLCNRKDLLYPYTASTLASHADVLGAWIIFPATKTWILLTRKRIQIKYLSTMFLRSAALDRHLHANIQSISWGDCMLPCKESTFSKLPNWWNVHWDDHITWNNKAETPKERWSVGAFSNCDNCIWMKYI